MIFDISEIESKIGYSFKNKMLLRKCFTHSSYSNEHGGENNEILEFFGDSIMEFIVTEHLFNNAFGDEGALTKKRIEMVSRDPLAKAVKKLGVLEYMLLGRGLEKRLDEDVKLISSLYESIVAGIYLDGGLRPTKAFIKRTLIRDFELKHKNDKKGKVASDAKNLFQEYVQKRKLGSISYQTLSVQGPAHLPEFRVAALLNGQRLAEAKGKSKKEAEKLSAEKALKLLIKQEGKHK